MIREKTLNLEGPLLEDQTMLKSLLECQAEVEKNRQILEETRFMGDHLEEKFAHYMPMIMQSAVLYNMIRLMCSLNPNYYLPFHKFIQIYTAIVKARDRGKGSSGRSNACSESNFLCFFLHSLKLLMSLISVKIQHFDFYLINKLKDVCFTTTFVLYVFVDLYTIRTSILIV